MSDNMLPEFISIESRRNVFKSALLTAFCVLWIIISITTLLSSIYFIIFGSDDPIWLWLAVLVIAIIFNTIWIQVWKGYKNRSYTSIRINEDGVQYCNDFSKKEVMKLEWREFESNANGSMYDVVLYKSTDTVPMGSDGVLVSLSSESIRWWCKRGQKRERYDDAFQGGHIMYGFRNRHELIAGFLLGLAHFRPDLRIDPLIFSTFFIDDVSYQFNRRDFYKVFVVSIVGIAVILLLIELYIGYRFGGSMIPGLGKLISCRSGCA